ncbi:MAG TPA: DsbA family oxidoreductase [Geminicoccaceae bacterium]|nr:DsbA family oxidoreductase [Geminicoccaceae bacterium]
MTERSLSDLADPADTVVELIADPSCPWCYIGFRRLARLQVERPFLLRWRPFLLDPYLPAEGIERALYTQRRLGGTEAGRRLDLRIAAVGRADGIRFEFERIRRAPSTILAQALLLEAQRRGRLAATAEFVFRTFFTEGGDIGDPTLLARLARRLALEPPEATPAGTAAIVAMHQAATEEGVSGVPVFRFAGRYTVAGAQPEEVLGAMLDLARYQARQPAAAGRSP